MSSETTNRQYRPALRNKTNAPRRGPVEVFAVKSKNKNNDEGYDSSDSWENEVDATGRGKNTSLDSDEGLNASIFSDTDYPDDEEQGLEEDEESVVDEEERAMEVSQRLNISKHLVAPMNEIGVTKCVLVRSQVKSMMPKYTLYVQGGDDDAIALCAIKKRTSTNYHIYDMSRGAPNVKNLTKKSGNYMGKLQGVGGKNPEYSLFTNSSHKEQIAAFKFTKIGIAKQLKVGQLPRQLHVLLPSVDDDGVHNTFRTSADTGMLERYKNGLKGKMEVFCTKEPTFERGQ